MGTAREDSTPRTPSDATATAPSGCVLGTLILVAAVANLNLSVANVALPDIGDALDASQVQLNLVAVAYSLGLSASVLYFGAIGDRYGRKALLLTGTGLTVLFSLLAAWSPSVEVLFVARVGGGLCAGMAFPTTLALISALWSGSGRTRAIALWSGIGAAFAALGPLAAGWVLTQFWWGSVFALTVPLAVLAFVLALVLVPAHVHESVQPVDHLGGTLSVLLVGALVMGINLLAVPDQAVLLAVLGAVVVGAGTWFVLRQLHADNPLYDLRVAARPTFWVAAVAGLIIFGSLMGAMYVGQLFMQNVLGYSSIAAGAAILPGAVGMVLVAPRSAALVERHGSRVTMLSGYVFVLLGFAAMLLLWREDVGYWAVGLAYLLVGIGVGLSGTPASNSLTGSVPVQRVGMASGTADLQRDLGGAILQSAFGALLAAGYAGSMATAVGDDSDLSDLTASMQATLEKSFAGAESIASQHPQYSDEIIAAARESFLAGDQWAYLAGIVAVLLGSLLVLVAFPRRDRERELRARYQPEAGAEAGPEGGPEVSTGR